mmetsp:Transcript_15747/g.25737  ORF Transcript_15747/g.25737 Transcript_15747/m.25737 type:complete len:82 (+) Transcript_15747:446-691(+)
MPLVMLCELIHTTMLRNLPHYHPKALQRLFNLLELKTVSTCRTVVTEQGRSDGERLNLFENTTEHVRTRWRVVIDDTLSPT